jgi:hypothetical protein
VSERGSDENGDRVRAIPATLSISLAGYFWDFREHAESNGSIEQKNEEQVSRFGLKWDNNVLFRANTFLSCLAIADIVFLSLLLPNIFANYPVFTYNYHFRWLYFHTKVHLLSFANWSSAVAIWCVIAVCTDRLIGIRNPLYIRAHVGSYKMSLLLFAIVAFPGVLTAYQHFAHVCLVRHYCRDTQVYSICLPVTQIPWINNQTNPYSESFRQFISVSKLLNVVLIIICPIILLTTLNMLLLCVLRQRSMNLMLMNGEDSSIK